MIKLQILFDGVPLKGYVASSVIFTFCARKKKELWEYRLTNGLNVDKITNM